MTKDDLVRLYQEWTRLTKEAVSLKCSTDDDRIDCSIAFARAQKARGRYDEAVDQFVLEEESHD